MSVAVGTALSKDRSVRRNRNRAVFSYGAIILFALLTLGMVVGHGSSLLNFAFPVMAGVLAGVLIRYRRSAYCAFTWWIWLASPEVRRLVDFHTSYHTISPVMLAPLAVTGFSVLSILRRPRILLRREMLPFSTFLLVTLLAFITGALSSGPLAAAFDWVNWLEPVFFAVFLVANKESPAEDRRALVSAIMLGLAVTAGYGIYQFFRFPAWDAFWLNNSGLQSAGRAFAEQVRIWGTLNGPGAYGLELSLGLILVLVWRGPMRVLGGAFGFPAFLLCEVRASWGAFVIGALLVLGRMSGKARLRAVVAGFLVAAIAVPIISVGPVATLLSARFNSIQNVQQDRSAQVRSKLYSSFIETALSEPVGIGFGAFGVSAKLSSGSVIAFDSGLLAIPYTFGWVGGLVLLWSLASLGATMAKNYLKSNDPITTAGAGAFFGCLATLIFGQVFQGVGGMVVWTAAALALGTPIGHMTKARKARL